MIKKRERQIGVGGSVISPLAKKLVNQVLDSGRLSYGPFLRRFENEFAHLCDRKFGITTSSGTTGLFVALQALKELGGWSNGDEVLVPAMTFIATSNIVLQNNLRPVFVDVDHKTFNIDPKKLERHITKRTRAIIPVHLFGLSADMVPIMRIARRHNIRVLEDSCETLGVLYRNKPIGSRGDIACFSMYMAHLITTGVGGVVLTNDPKIAIKVRSLANHGRDAIYIAADDEKGKRGKELKEIVGRRFSFINIGHSHRLTEMEGALGVAQIKELPGNIRIRQRNAARLLKGLSLFEKLLQLPTWPSHAEHAFMMFPIVILDPNISRDRFTEHLEDWNIETRPLMPLLNQPVYKELFGDIEHKYPVAQNAVNNGFYIGCHPEMTREDINYIIGVFAKLIDG